MSVRRWKFQDGATEITLPMNPAEMDGGVYGSRTVSAFTTTAGRVLVTEGAPQPSTLALTGTILTKEHFTTMFHWFAPAGIHNQRRITITDHFGRELVVVPLSFDPKPVRSKSHYWRHSFNATCMVLSAGAPTVDNDGNDI